MRDKKGAEEREAITARLGPRRRETALFYRRLVVIVAPVQTLVPMALAQPGGEVADYPATRNATLPKRHRRHNDRPGMSAIDSRATPVRHGLPLSTMRHQPKKSYPDAQADADGGNLRRRVKYQIEERPSLRL